MKVQLGDLSDSDMTLIDSGSEINLMSLEVYKQGGWPMTSAHHWRNYRQLAQMWRYQLVVVKVRMLEHTRKINMISTDGKEIQIQG